MGKKLRFIFILLCNFFFIFISLEISSRIYWFIKYDIPFFHTEKIMYRYYPELRNIQERSNDKDDSSFNILLLGGSVLHYYYGNIERILLEKLTYETRRRITISNASGIAHTSLDSYYKYKYLSDKQFDLVIFYHGINETRANNISSSLFKQDYSHYCWYKCINALDKHRHIIKYFSFPYTVEYLYINFSDKTGIAEYITIDNPHESWLRYGSSIKTIGSFKHNLMKIIDISISKCEPLLLMSFAYYISKNYTENIFKTKLLDYTLHSCAIKLRGTPKNVAAGISTHNKIIRQVSLGYESGDCLSQ